MGGHTIRWVKTPNKPHLFISSLFWYALYISFLASMKHYILPVLLLLLTTSCTNTSVEDRFVSATSEIACTSKQIKAMTKNPDSPDIGVQIQKAADAIAQKHDFKNASELDVLAQQYKNNQNMIAKVRSQINTMCP